MYLDISGTTASWVAALISATATGITLWVRWRDRPEADFFLEPGQVNMTQRLLRAGFNAPRMHDEALIVVNTGDGDAYRLLVTGKGCRVRGIAKDAEDQRGFRPFIVVPRLGPGDQFMVLVWNDEGTTPDQRAFCIEWLSSPTRHRRTGRKTIRRDEVLDKFPGEVERYQETSDTGG